MYDFNYSKRFNFAGCTSKTNNDDNEGPKGDDIDYSISNPSNRYTVTLVFGDDIPNETLKVLADTKVSKIKTNTRVDNKAITKWLINEDGQFVEFTGTINSDIVLYASGLTPIIDFETNGGKKINSIVAETGKIISLPKVEKTNSVFIAWEDELGGIYYNESDFVMPSDSIVLSAKWSFDRKYSQDVSHTIVYDSYTKNHYEEINISELYGMSISEMLTQGYQFVKMTLYLTMKEIDEGSERLILTRDWYSPTSASIWQRDFDHGGDSFSADSSVKTHTFEINCSIDSLANTIYLMYGAQGKQNYPWTQDDWNKWYLHGMNLYISIY